MEKGEFITNCAPLGYRIDGKKNLAVVEEEAEIVRWIYEAYLNGKSSDKIARELTERNVPTTDGKPFWRQNAVVYILTNEKYVGDTLCRKKYSTGFPFKKKLNRGEKEQYYVEQSHPAIITPETFERTRELLKERAQRERKPHREYPLTGKIRCGNCGAVFSRQASKSGRVVWVCRKHGRKASDCPVGPIPETSFYATFIHMGVFPKERKKVRHDGSKCGILRLRKSTVCRMERSASCLTVSMIPAFKAGVNNESQRCWEIFCPRQIYHRRTCACGSSL